MGLREIIGEATGAGNQVTWDAVASYLRTNYLENKDEVLRIEEAKKRDEYHDGGGEMGILRFIETAFKDPFTRKLRTDLVKWAKWNNVIRRVSSELATVYNEPARRSVIEDNDTYQRFLSRLAIDAIMREVDEKLVYHEDVWIQYRVRRATREPVLDVVSPSKFWAVHHPRDATHLVAVIIDQEGSSSDRDNAPRYRVWTADETFTLDRAKRFVSESVEEHGLGRIPGVLASTRPASAKGRLLTRSPAADLVAAHEAIWFIGVLLIKETKSANKQTIHTGDTTAAVMGQSADTETDVFVPEGVTTQSIDRGMDLAQFRDTATHILEQAAANHGLPPSVLHQRDAASGAEIHLRRIPIRELRQKRIPILREVERQLVQVQALVNQSDLPEFPIIPIGFAIDFGEVQQPLTETESLDVFEKKRKLGLTDNYEEEMRRNPDITSLEDAMRIVDARLDRQTRYVASQKNLMAMNGSLNTPTDQPTPEDNGRAGAAAAAEARASEQPPDLSSAEVA